MRASFQGLEMVKSGIQSAQIGLDVTGQNMAKMNVKGYTRQILNQSTIYYNSNSYKFALSNIDKFGQGVEAVNIVQARDEFLDERFRTANSDNTAYNKISDILSDLNDIFDETLKDGLGANFDSFYKDLQTLSVNAGKVEYSGLVRSSAQMITESLSYYYKQLQRVEQQHQYDLNVSVTEVNNLIDKLSELNTSIQSETLYGSPTNELLDSRNIFLDELSAQLNISVIKNDDGTINIKSGEHHLIDVQNAVKNKISINITDSGALLRINGDDLNPLSGEITGFIRALDGKGSFATEGEENFEGVKYYMNSLDALAKNFSAKMNELNGVDKPLFVGDTALTIGISGAWLADANYITSSTEGGDGSKNDNLLRMLVALDESMQQTDSFVGNFFEFVSGFMFNAAIDKNYYQDISDSTGTILSSISNLRESVMGVSLNEETVNLIKYQRAFDASARVMTAMDEMLNTVINGMGLVGR